MPYSTDSATLLITITITTHSSWVSLDGCADIQLATSDWHLDGALWLHLTYMCPMHLFQRCAKVGRYCNVWNSQGRFYLYLSLSLSLSLSPSLSIIPLDVFQACGSIRMSSICGAQKEQNNWMGDLLITQYLPLGLGDGQEEKVSGQTRWAASLKLISGTILVYLHSANVQQRQYIIKHFLHLTKQCLPFKVSH